MKGNRLLSPLNCLLISGMITLPNPLLPMPSCTDLSVTQHILN